MLGTNHTSSRYREFHKQHCHKSLPEVKGATKLLLRFLDNKALMEKIRIAIAIEFYDLIRTGTSVPRFRLIHVQFNIHPCKMEDLNKILSPQYSFHDLVGMKMIGCLNIVMINDVTDLPGTAEIMDPEVKENWFKTISAMRCMGRSDMPLFAVQFGYNHQRGLVTRQLLILPDDLHRAKVLKIAKERYPKCCTWANLMSW